MVEVPASSLLVLVMALKSSLFWENTCIVQLATVRSVSYLGRSILVVTNMSSDHVKQKKCYNHKAEETNWISDHHSHFEAQLNCVNEVSVNRFPPNHRSFTVRELLLRHAPSGEDLQRQVSLFLSREMKRHLLLKSSTHHFRSFFLAMLVLVIKTIINLYPCPRQMVFSLNLKII